MEQNKELLKTSRLINEKLNDLGRRNLSVYLYYCLCGQIALLTNKQLESIQTRRFDGSLIFDNDHDCFKLLSNPGRAVCIEHESKSRKVFETQFQHQCIRCGLPLGYELTAIKGASPFTFIYENALIEKIGDISKELASCFKK